MPTDRVCVDDFPKGDINNWLGEGHQVWVLINVEPILKWGHITRCLEEAPAWIGK